MLMGGVLHVSMGLRVLTVEPEVVTDTIYTDILEE